MDILKELSKYNATKEEINEVEQAIAQKGYWEKDEEWRIATVMTFNIKPEEKNERTWFITTVKCEQEVMIPAATIERAIIFMKAYRDFQIELFYAQDWASNEVNKMKK